MGLIHRIIKTSFYILICLINIIAVNSFAGWSAQQDIIQGSWGASENQFGITYQDTSDFIPFFDITSDQKVVIRDGMNSRVKVYTSSGALELIVPYKTNLDYRDLTIADKYGFSGDFVGYGGGGANYFYRADQKLYINFSPTGQLIKTSTTRPLELGVVKGNSPVDGGYRHIIEYPGQTYSFIIPFRVLNRFQRDLQGTLHVAAQSSTTDAVFRVSKCGRIAGQMQMPENVFGEPEKIGIEDFKTYLEEYGNAVFGSDGNIYTWKRTPDKYSILKWTWVDDPNVPNGPDAPTNLAVATSINGLYLTWAASPQDPGCVTTYEIYRATSAGGVGSTIGTVNVGTVKYNDTTATAGTTYYYKIRAKAGSEFSPYTAEVPGKR